jgi:hypothetical protein
MANFYDPHANQIDLSRFSEDRARAAELRRGEGSGRGG